MIYDVDDDDRREKTVTTKRIQLSRPASNSSLYRASNVIAFLRNITTPADAKLSALILAPNQYALSWLCCDYRSLITEPALFEHMVHGREINSEETQCLE